MQARDFARGGVEGVRVGRAGNQLGDFSVAACNVLRDIGNERGGGHHAKARCVGSPCKEGDAEKKTAAFLIERHGVRW
ncbi:MAG: hypothetical protein H3C50_02030 [Kiritimatiellae bacterium]|nr:hypothetical protein [Kiritimatiellia bacterium]